MYAILKFLETLTERKIAHDQMGLFCGGTW